MSGRRGRQVPVHGDSGRRYTAWRQLCNHWSNHGALDSQITPPSRAEPSRADAERNGTKCRHACITECQEGTGWRNADNVRRTVLVRVLVGLGLDGNTQWCIGGYTRYAVHQPPGFFDSVYSPQ